jgi:hypothetical protein
LWLRSALTLWVILLPQDGFVTAKPNIKARAKTKAIIIAIVRGFRV